MTHDCAVRQRPSAPGRRRCGLLSGVLCALLIVSLWGATSGGVSAGSLTRDGLSTGTTLAVVRAGGVGLYDDGGQLLRELAMGAAVKVSGRTVDNRWFYGSIKDGTTGWVSSASVVIFGVKNVPERGGFTPPAQPVTAAPGAAGGTAGAAATTASTAAQAATTRSGGAADAVRLPAVASERGQSAQRAVRVPAQPIPSSPRLPTEQCSRRWAAPQPRIGSGSRSKTRHPTSVPAGSALPTWPCKAAPRICPSRRPHNLQP